MKFTRSNEPIVWSMFGAGGMVAAFLLPALILCVGLLFPFDFLDTQALSHARVLAFSSYFVGKICWLTLIIFPLWHAMHRIYHLLHDFKVGARGFFFVLCYGFAFVVSLLSLILDFRF